MTGGSVCVLEDSPFYFWLSYLYSSACEFGAGEFTFSKSEFTGAEFEFTAGTGEFTFLNSPLGEFTGEFTFNSPLKMTHL